MPTAPTFREFLFSAVEIEDHPDYEKWPIGKRVLWITHQLSGALLRYHDVLASSDPRDDEEFEQVIHDFLERYVIPLDITGRRFVEQFVDSQMLTLAPPAITKMLAGLVQERMPD